MTSGTFQSIEIAAITVGGDRQRKVIRDVDVLAESIGRLGLINPVTITRELLLVAGERRLEACKLLGWTHIHAHFTDETDTPYLRAVELEENIKRENLPWQEESAAIFEYHHLRMEEVETWDAKDTAAALGYSVSNVNRHLSVARELQAGNQKILSAPKFSTALGITSRAAERRDERALSELKSSLGEEFDTDTFPGVIATADFHSWAASYSGPKFNFIHCDFPYGINASQQKQGGAVATHGGYHDDEENYWNLCSTLTTYIDSLAAESCHFMFWFSMHFYASTRDYFDRAGIIFDPFPLIWVKSDNIGLLPDPSRGPRRIYETAFFGSRGDRKIVRAISNAFSSPTVRERHMSEKPQHMLQHFFQMFVDQSTLMLDPTCGSGSSVRAAEAAGATAALGLELNEEFADGARLALERSRRSEK